MTRKIICIGGVTIDRKIQAKDTLKLGTSNPVTSVRSFGGVAHNVAKNLSQLGADVFLQSAVGDDVEGNEIISHLKKSAINVQDMQILQQQSTARYDVILNPDGEMVVALADMAIFDIPIEFFTQRLHKDDIVFIDTNFPSELLNQVISECRAKNILLCVDPVSVAKSKKLPLDLHGIHVIKPDRLEAEVLAGRQIDSIEECVEAGQIILKKGVKHCVISLGKLGYVIVNEALQQHCPVMQLNKIVDVSGAGDGFMAGILFSLSQNRSIENACEIGATLAALTLQSYQTVNETITLEMVQEFLS